MTCINKCVFRHISVVRYYLIICYCNYISRIKTLTDTVDAHWSVCLNWIWGRIPDLSWEKTKHIRIFLRCDGANKNENCPKFGRRLDGIFGWPQFCCVPLLARSTTQIWDYGNKLSDNENVCAAAAPRRLCTYYIYLCVSVLPSHLKAIYEYLVMNFWIDLMQMMRW